MSLRTGRLSLYRDFANDPYEPGKRPLYDSLQTEEGPEPYLRDWASLGKLPKLLAPVEGTCYTLLIPIPANR